MGEKPRFWSFFRAYRQSKMKEDLLYIYERKKGKLALYKKLPLTERRRWRNIMLISSYAVYLAVVISAFVLKLLNVILWFGICWDFILLGGVLLYILLIMGHKLLHSTMAFEKISEIDWNDEKEAIYKKTRSHYKMIYIINAVLWSLLFLMNSFSLAYLKYLAEGGQQAGSASVFIHTYDGSINLSKETPYGKVFDIKDRQGSLTEIDISTDKIPEQVKLYINGEETDYTVSRISSFSNFFSDYFDIDISGEISLDLPEGQNTLELKSDSFYKKWTFTLEYE